MVGQTLTMVCEHEELVYTDGTYAIQGSRANVTMVETQYKQERDAVATKSGVDQTDTTIPSITNIDTMRNHHESWRLILPNVQDKLNTQDLVCT